jgi:hypothetical protein
MLIDSDIIEDYLNKKNYENAKEKSSYGDNIPERLRGYGEALRDVCHDYATYVNGKKDEEALKRKEVIDDLIKNIQSHFDGMFDVRVVDPLNEEN